MGQTIFLAQVDFARAATTVQMDMVSCLRVTIETNISTANPVSIAKAVVVSLDLIIWKNAGEKSPMGTAYH